MFKKNQTIKIYRKTYTYVLDYSQHKLLKKMAKESALAYNQYISLFNTNPDFNFCDKQAEKTIYRKYLYSGSFQGAYQSAKDNIIGFFASIKKFKQNSSGFTSKPQFPKGIKRTHVIIFKKPSIRVKNGFLLLSTKFRNNPIKIKWNPKLTKPVFATISKKFGKWHLSCVFEEPEVKIIDEPTDKILSIDLGIKRIAATFDGSAVTTYNGKPLLELCQLENKKKAEIQKIKSTRKKKYTRRQKRLLCGHKKQLTKIKNKRSVILHKYSRQIVNNAVKSGISHIVVGDCASIHTNTNLGAKTNQKVQQGQEQKLAKQIEYKFKRIGGRFSVIDESYSTQTCPVCGNRHKPQTRTYQCNCGFKYDRDGVGSINIYKKVSHLSVRSGCLTHPTGVRYKPENIQNKSSVKT